MKSDQFPRVRIGIGGNGDKDIIDFVIGGFRKEEVSILEETVDKAVMAIESMIGETVDIAMNKYNSKKTEGGK